MFFQIYFAISGVEDKEDSKAGSGSTPMKVLPPWMIKQGMKLTKEQRGEVKEDTKTEITSDSSALSDDKKSTVTKDEKSFQVVSFSSIIQKVFFRAYGHFEIFFIWIIM